jgi:hypothetical protein
LLTVETYDLVLMALDTTAIAIATVAKE